jgi:hypothetical protein
MPMKPTGPAERVFHTGRNQVAITGMIIGAVFLAFGFALLVLTWRDEKEYLGPLALVLAVFILGGGWMLGGYLLVFLRQKLAIHSDGVLITNWSGRQVFVRWPDLEGSVMAGRAGRWVDGGTYSTSTLTLYLLVKASSGETMRLEVARIGSQATATEITSALAERAGLTYVGEQRPGLNAGEVAWRRQSMVSTESAQEQPAVTHPAVAYGETAAIHDAAPETQDTASAVVPAKPHGPPERIFHTGRTTAIEFYIYFPLLSALLGAAFLFPAWAGEGTAEQIPSLKHLAELSTMTACGWSLVVAGICISMIHMINYARSALVVYLDGLVFRNWLGRRRFIPWSDLEGVTVTYKVAFRVSGAPDTPYVTLYLMLRLAGGGTRRLKVSLARQWEPMYADLTSTLAQRANLEYSGRNEGQEVWRRRPDSGRS